MRAVAAEAGAVLLDLGPRATDGKYAGADAALMVHMVRAEVCAVPPPPLHARDLPTLPVLVVPRVHAAVACAVLRGGLRLRYTHSAVHHCRCSRWPRRWRRRSSAPTRWSRHAPRPSSPRLSQGARRDGPLPNQTCMQPASWALRIPHALLPILLCLQHLSLCHQIL